MSDAPEGYDEVVIPSPSLSNMQDGWGIIMKLILDGQPFIAEQKKRDDGSDTMEIVIWSPKLESVANEFRSVNNAADRSPRPTDSKSPSSQAPAEES